MSFILKTTNFKGQVHKKYKYSGYTYKGEVRVSKADTSGYISIRNDNDLDKIF